MNKVFITYADSIFEQSKSRICREAENLGIFDKILSYSPNDVSKELKKSKVFSAKRGGGLWSWKPDVILRTMNTLEDGDYIIYCDAGCSLLKSKEWEHRYFKDLETCDIRAIKIFQKNYKWIRKETIDYFESNPDGWLNEYQVCATLAIKVSQFTRHFFNEWRELMINHPEFVMDVPENMMKSQNIGFIENRHDQALYSSLVYKYLYTGKIKIVWEHIEGYDPIFSQAVIASRLKNGEKLSITFFNAIGQFVKWAIKHIIYIIK